MSSSQNRSRAAAAALLALVAGLAGCSAQGSSAAAAQTPGSKPSPGVAPVSFTVTPDADAARVRLDEPVSVRASNGTLTSVTVRARSGKKVAGALAEDGSGWTSRRPLAPGTTYTVTAKARDKAGTPTEATSTFRTLTPKRPVAASFQPGSGWTVGVGMPVIVYFDQAVRDRAKAEQSLTVSSTPAVTGDWRWFSDRQVQWRPKAYWPAGTRVSVKADLKGVKLGPGTWGTKNYATDFRVGSSMISTVNTATHTLTVRRNGKVIRSLPVTTGKAGFQTRNGTKVIMSRESSRRMDAATTGTDPKDPDYYNVLVRYAMRLTNSGEFLHAAPWSVGSQGRANVSHGCTGMSTANAAWLFQNSKVGDVVVYTGSSRALEWGNGITVWQMPYKQWRS